jgi:2',3'-cyclic-nucleotide 2'-phosphodiesterase (5'-nucleotidase family)
MVEELEVADCDVIIALAHMGDSPSSTATDHSDALAAVPGVDVIIDGHSHSYLPEGKVSGEALIAQTGQYGENIGVVKLTINDEQITKTAELIAIPVVDESEEPSADEAVDLLPLDEAILEIVTLEDEKTAPITDAVVGEAPVLLQGERELVRTQDTNLAHLIVDSMRWTTGADIAFLSAGNIRAEIPEGEITMGEVLTTLPFSNLIVSVEMGGSDVLAMLEYGVSLYPESTAVHIQISGLQFKFDPALPAGSRVTGVTMVDGSALDPDGRYTVATIEFLAAGGDGYEMVSNGTDLKYYGGDAEVFVDYLATNPTIETEAEARVQAVSGDAGASVRPTIFIILATMLVIVVIIVVVITIRGRKKH